MNDCRLSCDYQSFLCFDVGFFKRLFATRIHIEIQQLLIQLQYMPDIAFYENRKNRTTKPYHETAKTEIVKTAVGVQLFLICKLTFPDRQLLFQTAVFL